MGFGEDTADCKVDVVGDVIYEGNERNGRAGAFSPLFLWSFCVSVLYVNLLCLFTPIPTSKLSLRRGLIGVISTLRQYRVLKLVRHTSKFLASASGLEAFSL